VITRYIPLTFDESFLLFGARGTGKSTLINGLIGKALKKNKKLKIEFIDLLDTDQYENLILRPALLREQIEASKPDLVIIDEIQKIPGLLDIVHQLIEKYKNIKFGLTGSSARKLKRDGANLLAGRALSYRLHPISFIETKQDLIETLTWGSLPKIYSYSSDLLKKKYLRTYTQTYLREEIQLEQITRNLVGFRNFLSVAAQMNGKIVSFSKIAATSGVDEKSVGRFFEILNDTLVGFLLDPYHQSIRKRQTGKPKFYFFDIGVARAMGKQLDLPVLPGNYAFGDLFEQMIVLEFIRLNDYLEKDYSFSYLRTGSGVEIDLVVERPGQKLALVEIKSTERVGNEDAKSLRSFTSDFPGAELVIISREKKMRKLESNILVMPWQQGIKYVMGI
jgi:predicted AAA+ superfamily ATPase